MKKKQDLKLKLDTQTVRALATTDLASVGGGISALQRCNSAAGDGCGGSLAYSCICTGSF